MQLLISMQERQFYKTYLSGEILYEKDPDKSIYPASMTKIMTSIVAFDLIKSGDLRLRMKNL